MVAYRFADDRRAHPGEQSVCWRGWFHPHWTPNGVRSNTWCAFQVRFHTVGKMSIVYKKTLLICDQAGIPSGVAGAYSLMPVPFDAHAPEGTSFSAWASRTAALNRFGDLPLATVAFSDCLPGGTHPVARRQIVLALDLNPWCRLGAHVALAEGLAVCTVDGQRCLLPACADHDRVVAALEDIQAQTSVELRQLSRAVGERLVRRRLATVPVSFVCRCAQGPTRLGVASFHSLCRLHLHRGAGGTLVCPDTGSVLRASPDLDALWGGVRLDRCSALARCD